MRHTSSIKIVLAEDHSMFRKALVSILNKDAYLSVVAQVENGQELVDAVKHYQPDVIVTDLRMPIKNGMEALKEIYSEKTNVKAIAITMFDDDFKIIDALEAGAHGYINKRSDSQEFVEAVKSVNSGIPYYCKTTSLKMAGLVGESNFDPYIEEPKQLFSAMEKKIILMICHDLSSKEIGERLLMGKKNVDLYRGRILNKMKVKTAAGVAIYAIKHQLISIKDIKTAE